MYEHCIWIHELLLNVISSWCTAHAHNRILSRIFLYAIMHAFLTLWCRRSCIFASFMQINFCTPKLFLITLQLEV